MKGTDRSSRKVGASLVEVLVAALVLAITAILVYPVFVSGQRLEASAKYRIIASNLARETLEKLRAASMPDQEVYRVDPIPDTHFFSQRLNALRDYRISQFKAGGEVVGKRITVTVTWDATELGREARNRERLVLFVSDRWGLTLCP